MELWRLRNFTVLAEVLHFGRAAERLHLTQPALSQQVKKLESELGVSLVQRGRQTSLTPAGAALAEAAGPLLRHAERVSALVRTVDAGMRGSLRVMLTRSAPGPVFHDLLEQFRERHPDVAVQIEAAWTTHNLDMLRADAADVAAVLLPLADDSGLEVCEWTRVPLAVILPPKHRLARRRSIPVRELVKEPVVTWPREQAPGAWDRLVRTVWEGHEPRIARIEPDIERMLAAVADGHGFTFTTRDRAQQLRGRGVAVRELRAPAPDYVFGLCWQPSSTNPALASFAAAVRGHGRGPGLVRSGG